MDYQFPFIIAESAPLNSESPYENFRDREIRNEGIRKEFMSLTFCHKNGLIPKIGLASCKASREFTVACYANRYTLLRTVRLKYMIKNPSQYIENELIPTITELCDGCNQWVNNVRELSPHDMNIIRRFDMKNGDISNMSNFTIAVRVEGTLFKMNPKAKVIDKIKGKLTGNPDMYILDEDVFSYIKYIVRNTEYTVDLVLSSETRQSAWFNKHLDDLFYSCLYVVDKDTQLSSRLLVGEISYYVDDDEQRRANVSSRWAFSVNEMKSILNYRPGRR